jgi:hypothetical protein
MRSEFNSLEFVSAPTASSLSRSAPPTCFGHDHFLGLERVALMRLREEQKDVR